MLHVACKWQAIVEAGIALEGLWSVVLLLCLHWLWGGHAGVTLGGLRLEVRELRGIKARGFSAEGSFHEGCLLRIHGLLRAEFRGPLLCARGMLKVLDLSSHGIKSEGGRGLLVVEFVHCLETWLVVSISCSIGCCFCGFLI